MFHVAICDDEEVICTQMENILEPYISQHVLSVDLFYSGEKLYEAMSDGAHYDLIFLDIELRLMNGVDVGKKIRKEMNNQRVQIVYISGKQEYAMELFAIRPMNFLVKPFSAEAVLDNLQQAMELADIYDACFEFQIGSEHFRVPYGDILYFESSNRKIRLHMQCETKELYGKLKAIEKDAPPNFIRIHQSYFINRNYVAFWKAEEVRLSNDCLLPISQAYRKKVRRILLQSERGPL